MREDGKIDYIELPGGDLPATKGFYAEAFGWNFIDYGPQYAAFDNGGVDGGFNADPADQTKAPLVVLFATDLEVVLAAHPDVRDVAVIGVPSAEWGETPLALVVTRPGTTVTADDLRGWANAQLGKAQRISAVEFRHSLPRNALGKILKRELRAPYWPA